MPKKKIAFFINSLGGSGAEKVVSLLVNNFCDQFDIHLVLLTDTIDFDIPKEKIHIYIIDRSELFATNRIKDILKIPFLSYKLKKYLHKNNINVCFSFLVRSN